jgi:hypothetical protein
MNVLNYFPENLPTFAQQNREFKFWHTEALLNQAGNLIDQAMKQLADFNQLEALEFNVNQDIERLEKEIEIEEKKNVWERDIRVNELYMTYLKNRTEFDKNVNESKLGLKNETGNSLDKDYPNPVHRQISAYSGWIQFNENMAFQQSQIYDQSIADEKRKWLNTDKDLGKQLLDQRKKALDERKVQLVKTKALDYTYQKTLCFNIIDMVYRDCLNRALVAEYGLIKIFGVKSALKELLDKQDDMQYRLNTLYQWVYQQIIFMTAYGQTDQTYTLSVSLRSILSQQDFDDMINCTDEDFIAQFALTKNQFPILSHDNTRLKGIGAYITGKAGILPWTVLVQLPRNVLYTRGGDESWVNFEIPPFCTMGRVRNMESTRPVEFVGMISLNNISPFCSEVKDENGFNQWGINIKKPVSEKERFADIEDIYLELILNANR